MQWVSVTQPTLIRGRSSFYNEDDMDKSLVNLWVELLLKKWNLNLRSLDQAAKDIKDLGMSEDIIESYLSRRKERDLAK